jgi:hypothetical protein
MPVSPAVARLSAQLRTAWLHAAQRAHGKPFVIPTSTKNDAVQLRFKLYNIAKPIRAGTKDDPEFLEALSKVKISVGAIGENRWGVIMGRKTEEDDLLAALAGAGVEVSAEPEPPSPDFSGVLQRLQAEGLMPAQPMPPLAVRPMEEPPMAVSDPFITKNPFYTRTGTGRVE